MTVVVVICALALGALLRKTAAELSDVFAAVFFVIPVVVNALPHTLTGFAPYLRPAGGSSARATRAQLRWAVGLDSRACAATSC